MAKIGNRISVQVYMKKDEVEIIDAICEAMETSRSQFFTVAALNHLETFATLKKIGLTAKRVHRFEQFLAARGISVGREGGWKYDPDIIPKKTESSSMETA